MSKNNLIIVVIAIILIIILMCVISGNDKKDNVTNDSSETINVFYNTVTDEITGQDEYIIYNEETGMETGRVTSEFQLKIFENNPDYEEIPVDNRDSENNNIEY